MSRANPGILVPLVTPLIKTGEVCEISVAALVDQVRPFAAGLVPALTSGEGWRLTNEQWRAMVSYTIRCAKGLPVYAGVELPTTGEVLERSRHAAVLGVDAVVITTPFGGDVEQEAMHDHVATVERESGTRVIFYNESSLSGNETTVATLTSICDLVGVVGVKESSGDPEVARALIQHGADVSVYQGWEHLLIDPQGVDGYAIALANLEPELCAQVFATPTPQGLQAVMLACTRYGLFDDDWFRGLKEELRTRGVIGTDQLVAEAKAS